VEDLIARALASPEDDPLYVAPIGAITNIASAIRLAPEIVRRIVVVWLGGQPHHLHFARDSKLPAGVQAFDTAGKRVTAAAFRNVKTDKDVSLSRFKFTPPEGAQHIEFSDAGTKLLPSAPP